MATASSQRVMVILSVSRNGPTLVSQSNAVPTPDDWEDVTRTATASFIHRGWVRTSSMVSQTCRGVAAMVVSTRMRATAGAYG